MLWPIYNRISGNISFHRKNIFRGPTRGVKSKKSGISKLSEYYVVGTLNLCQETPDPMQKESAQSDQPAGRKRPKRAKILGYFGVCPNQQNWTTFWTFSPGRVIGLSWFLLHCFRHLQTQVYSTHTVLFWELWNSTFIYICLWTKIISRCSHIYRSPH